MASSICRITRDATTKAVTGFDFDPSKMVVGEPRKLAKGKFCNVRYNGGPLYFETPYLHSPTSVSKFDDADKVTLFLSFRGHEDRADVKAFLDALTSAQDRIVEQASELKLLGEKSTPEMMESLMSTMIKVSDSGYPPAFRITLPMTKDGKYAIDAFKPTDAGPVELSLDNIDLRGARVRAIFTISSVWVVNKQWGVSLKATQLLVRPNFDIPAAGISNFSDDALVSEDDDSRDRLHSDEDA